nr:hypothetical protein CFP56_46564 [Quercus suber]
MIQRTVIRVAGMDEKGTDDEDDRQMDGGRGDEGSGSKEKRNTAAGKEKGAREGEEDGDVAESINEGAFGTESPTNPNPINDGYTIMDVTLNSLARLNSGNNNQKEDFSRQLEEIEKEILKFDNVHVNGVNLADSAPKKGVGLQKVYSVDGLGEVGLQKVHSVNGLREVGHNLSNKAGKKKLMTQKRTWVRREQNRGEPSGNTFSVLKKRMSREDDAETEFVANGHHRQRAELGLEEELTLVTKSRIISKETFYIVRGFISIDCGSDEDYSTRTWVQGFSKPLGTTTVLMAELWALREGLRMARRLNIYYLIANVDSSNVVKLFSSSSSTNRLTRPLVAECKDILQAFQ